MPYPTDATRILRDVSLKQVLFTPLEAAYLGAGVQRLQIDLHEIARSNELPPGAPYQLAGRAAATGEPSEEERALLTALPENLNMRVRELAAEITKNSSSDLEKTARVSQYLSANYEYDLGAGPSDAKDPICAFLFDVRKGHCEFFASSAAVLLRCAGVPCRYATGFVTSEQNTFGGYWVARNRDAHAWVEAYVEGDGWMVVEATPASGVPAGQNSNFAQLWDYLRYLPKAAFAALRQLGLKELALQLLRGIAAALWGAAGILLIPVVLGALILWLMSRRRKGSASKAAEADPLAVTMQGLLRKMDARLAREAFVRAPYETLHHFARRVEMAGQAQAAQWYRTYARLRYGASPDEGAIEALAQSLQNL
jgi:hypothetical protein